MPQQNGNKPTSINPRLSDDFSTLWGDGQQPPAAPSGSQPIYSNVGGAMIPFDPNQLANMPNVDPARDYASISSMAPAINEGPYAPGATGETAREYRQQYNSPYVTALAQHLGVSHPRLANLIDSGVLGMESAQAAHERSLAANGGIEGAGGGIADALAGLTGPQQMRLAHREQLESLPLQYAQEQGGLEQQQATTLAERLRALSEYESNPSRVLAQVGRGAVAAGIGANQRLQSTRINASERYNQSLNDEANKLKIAQIKAQYAHSNAAQQQHYQQSFLNSYRSHLDSINSKYDAYEMRLQQQKNGGLITPQQYDQQHELNESNRQAEKDSETQYANFASGQIFGTNLLAPQQPQLPVAPKSGTALTDPSIAKQYLSAAGGNKTKARKLAKQNGWKF